MLEKESGFLNGSLCHDSQEVPNPASSGVTVVSAVVRCFHRQKNKQTEVDKAIRSTRKQNKIMKR